MAALLLIIAAGLCELVAALSSFGWLIHADHIIGWIALGLFFYFAFVLFGGYQEARKA